MNKFKIDENNIKQRLDAFLVNYFENKYSRSQITNAIEKEYFLNVLCKGAAQSAYRAAPRMLSLTEIILRIQCKARIPYSRQRA